MIYKRDFYILISIFLLGVICVMGMLFFGCIYIIFERSELEQIRKNEL